MLVSALHYCHFYVVSTRFKEKIQQLKTFAMNILVFIRSIESVYMKSSSVSHAVALVAVYLLSGLYFFLIRSPFNTYILVKPSSLMFELADSTTIYHNEMGFELIESLLLKY